MPFGPKTNHQTFGMIGASSERQGEVPKPEDSISQAKMEAREEGRSVMSQLKSLCDRLKDAVVNPKKTELKVILRDLEIAVGNFPGNHAYLYKSFEEHVENVVTDAKASVEAHYMAVATRAQLVEGYTPPKLIEEAEK